MTPQERDLILGLFQRLKAPAEGEIDQEARELIDRLGREQPLALYLLAQTTLVQEHALKGAQARIAELEAKLTQAGSAGPAPEAPHRSFLSGLFGGATAPAPAAARPGYAPQPVAAAPGPWGSPGPSFLQSALSTAAGVAGGALLFQGIERLLGYGGSPFAGAGWTGASGLGTPVEEVIVENYGARPQGVPDNPGSSQDPLAADDASQTPDATEVDDPGIDSGDNGFGDGPQDV